MPVPSTVIESLRAKVPYMLAGSREVRDFFGVMPSVVPRQRLSEEYTWVDLGIEPITYCVSSTLTEKGARQLDASALVSWARRAQKQIQVRKNRDGLNLFQLATHDMGGLGTTLSLNTIAAARARLEGAQPNPATGYIFAVLHPYSAYPISEEPIKGSYAVYQDQRIPQGMRRNSFMRHYRGEFRRVQVFVDPHLRLNPNDDVVNGIFSQDGITLVEGKSPTIEIEPDGADGVRMRMCDSYVYEEHPPFNHLIAYTADACTPT